MLKQETSIVRSLVGDPHWRTKFERSFGHSFANVKIHIGRAIDRKLASQQAIAQTIDDKNILLSRRISQLTCLGREAILGHELAHTIQLGRKGSDSRTSLEAEAWRGTIDALRGKRHEIKGAGSNPLNAHAIIAYPPAKPYYEWIKSEPVKSGGSISIPAKPETLAGADMNLLILMKRMALANSKDILVVAHGSPTGIRIPIVPGGNKFISVGVHLKKLIPLVNLAIAQQKSGAKNAAGLKLSSKQKLTLNKIGFNPERLWVFSKVTRAVRLKGLNRVVLRTCFTGMGGSLYLDPLEIFRDLFGASTVSGVTTFAAFGTVHLRSSLTSSRAFSRWLSRQNKSRLFQHPATNPGFAFTISKSRPYKISARVRSWSAVEGWIKSHLHGQAKYKQGSDFPIYLLNPASPVFPLDYGFRSQLRVTAPKVPILPI